MVGSFGLVDIMQVANILATICTNGSKKDCKHLPQKLVYECNKAKGKNCYETVLRGVELHCNLFKNLSACKWLTKTTLPPTQPTTPRPTTSFITTTTTTTTTTTLAPATTVISDSSTDASSNLPLVIVAVITILAFIAIGISLFCYCKKKKAAGKKEPMTGVTTGSNSASGTSAKGATTPKKSEYVNAKTPEKSNMSNIKTAMNY